MSEQDDTSRIERPVEETPTDASLRFLDRWGTILNLTASGLYFSAALLASSRGDHAGTHVALGSLFMTLAAANELRMSEDAAQRQNGSELGSAEITGGDEPD